MLDFIKDINCKTDLTNNKITCEIVPDRNEQQQIIYLTKSKSAWISIQWLSDELIAITKKQYQNLFNLHPIDRGKVVMYDNEINLNRWNKSYLNTPLRSAIHKKKSYMYAGKSIEDKDTTLPNLFQPYLDFVNKNEQLYKYNQVIVNWYLDGNDFIAAHSDCQLGMKPNAEIAILTLNENEADFRTLKFIPKRMKVIENDAIYNQIEIAALNACIITMHGDTQEKFRHKISKASHINSSRISITFRKF